MTQRNDTSPRRIPAVWLIAALAVFCLGTASVLELSTRDLHNDVLSWTENRGSVANARLAAALMDPNRADTAFAVWLVSRNAYTLVRRPWRLFDTEHCAPAERTITLSEPMITVGLLAVPFYLMTGDPILTYNLAIWALWSLAGMAIFCLIAAWTGMPLAGIAAGLLYVFHPAHAADIWHPTLADMTWTIFAMFFAQRWFAGGRWRDAIGLSASVVLQIGASFYPFVAAFFLCVPYTAWLLSRYRFRKVGRAQVAFVILAIAAGAAVLLGPYLATRGEAHIIRRSVQIYASWRSLFPSPEALSGWLALALTLIAIASGPRRSTPGIDGDPRWSLLAGAALVALAATGGSGRMAQDASTAWSFPPNIYAIAASFLPGLDAVRVVLKLKIGFHLAVCILAGIGVAGTVRLARRRWQPAVAIAIVCLAAVEAFRPAALGFAPQYRWGPMVMRPSDEVIEFFAELERQGNRGPLLEVPMRRANSVPRIARLLHSAWHHRRTSHCYGSYLPPELERVIELSERIPDPAAIHELRRLGFTTIIADSAPSSRFKTALDAAARTHPKMVRHLHQAGPLTAYSIAE